jgi:hypothetical protein
MRHTDLFNTILMLIKAFVPLFDEIVHLAAKSGLIPDSWQHTSRRISTPLFMYLPERYCVKDSNKWKLEGAIL